MVVGGGEGAVAQACCGVEAESSDFGEEDVVHFVVHT